MSETKKYGILAEFDNPAELLHAAENVKAAGYKKFDCHSPFPIHGMDDAMGLSRSPLAKIIAIIAFFAMIAGISLQWYANAYDYPLVISGKPYFSYQAYAPVAFAIVILTCGICTVVIMLALNGLPKLFHPLFYSSNFQKVTDDGFFISIETRDQKFDDKGTKEFLESIGGTNLEVV